MVRYVAPRTNDEGSAALQMTRYSAWQRVENPEAVPACDRETMAASLQSTTRQGKEALLAIFRAFFCSKRAATCSVRVAQAMDETESVWSPSLRSLLGSRKRRLRKVLSA